LLGCHLVSSVKEGAKAVLALHYLVTTSSVKKRLMGLLRVSAEASCRAPEPVMQGAHSFVKIGAGGGSPIASAPFVKE